MRRLMFTGAVVLVVCAALFFAGTAVLTAEEGKDAPPSPAPPKEKPAAKDDAAVKAKAIASMKKAIEYLKKSLNADGAVEIQAGPQKIVNAGMTALVMNAFNRLPDELKGDVKEILPKMAAFLVKSQNPDGSIQGQADQSNYQTALAAIALMRYDKETYKDAIKKAITYLLFIQVVDEKDIAYGGWGYKKNDPSTPEKKYQSADLSNTHFTLEALNLYGDNTSEAYKRAVKFLERCQNRSESNDSEKVDPSVKVGNDGGCVYGPGNTRSGNIIKTPEGKIEYVSYASMTYAGLKSLIYANVSKDDPRVQAAWNWVKKNYTLDENYGMGTRDKKGSQLQGLYYFYHIFAKAMQALGEKKIVTQDGVEHDWRIELIEKIVTLQKPDGSWVNSEAKWLEDIPILVSAYTLEAMDIAYYELNSNK